MDVPTNSENPPTIIGTPENKPVEPNVKTDNPVNKTTSENTSVPPPGSSEPPGKNKKLLIALVLIVLLLLVGVVVIVMSTQGSKKEVTVVPTPTLVPSPTVDPLSNWETFTSSESGFVIKHPVDVKVSVHQEAGKLITVFSKTGPTQKEGTEFYDGISLALQSSELGSQTLTEFVNKEVAEMQKTGNLTKPPLPISVSGVNGITFEIQSMGTFTYIYLPDGGGYMKITDGTVDPTNKGFAETVQQMLSTIRFTAEETVVDKAGRI
jgi:hypothetical protein